MHMYERQKCEVDKCRSREVQQGINAKRQRCRSTKAHVVERCIRAKGQGGGCTKEHEYQSVEMHKGTKCKRAAGQKCISV